MIARTLERKLRELDGYYPVVVVTGQGRSGKPPCAVRRSRTRPTGRRPGAPHRPTSRRPAMRSRGFTRSWLDTWSTKTRRSGCPRAWPPSGADHGPGPPGSRPGLAGPRGGAGPGSHRRPAPGCGPAPPTFCGPPPTPRRRPRSPLPSPLSSRGDKTRVRSGRSAGCRPYCFRRPMKYITPSTCMTSKPWLTRFRSAET